MFKKRKLRIFLLIAIMTVFILASCKDPEPKIEYCNITWHLNGGQWTGSIQPVKIEKDTVLSRPSNPIKEGKSFGGWYTEAELINAYDFISKVTDNLNLYAKWTDTNEGDRLTVTNSSNSGSGSLRQVIANASAGDTITIDDSVKTIYLEDRITIGKSLTIEGNGVTITRAPSWITENSISQLMYINSSTAQVNITRIWFKNGKALSGAAIEINTGNVTFESCVFSGNQSTYGGAVYKSAGNLIVRGCTFYNNSANSTGGAIYNSSGGTLTLTGNIFYGNTSVSYPIAAYGTKTSLGYNVVDVPLGTSSSQAGWSAGTGDIKIDNLPFATKSFKLFSDSEAAGIITDRPDYYPTLDFYGNEIPETNAAAGAVQEIITGSGWNFDWSVNNSSAGEVIFSNGTPDEDGLYSGTVTLEASVNSGYEFSHWLINGEEETDNPLNLTIDSHTIVQAVFIKVPVVYNVTSNANSGAGTFRQALTDAQDGDIINFNLTAPNNLIQLTSRLPDITKSITINGNGVTITRASSWTTVSSSTQFMYINSSTAEVKISRMLLKDGYATNYGGAIYNNGGNLFLESCIFSGNRNYTNGGAIYNTGNLDIKGCTFFDNYAGARGGAIYSYNGTVNITGNLFIYNGANTGNPTIYSLSSTITSGGFNVVDNPLGTLSTQSGWSSAAGDKSISIDDIPVSNVTFRLLSNSEASSVITNLPDDYPETDFYGNEILHINAASGAVQDSVTADGYCIIIMKNYDERGTIQIDGTSNADGLYSGQVTLTANEASGFKFSYWLDDNTMISSNILNLTMNDHKNIYAVFSRIITVTSSIDTTGTASNPTLRYALNNAEIDDIINLELTGDKTITLTSNLPQITKRIIIEGNGATLTRSALLTSSSTSQLLRISSAANDVIINRLHFKNGRATDYGAAIRNEGILVLSSCIFSGNQTTASMSYGGAIYNSGKLVVAGCTFYNNSANLTNGYGGAIYNYTNTQSYLVANIFNQNYANTRPVIYGTVTESSGNVTDVSGGTGSNQSGLDSINNVNFPDYIPDLSPDFLFIDTTTFVPVDPLRDLINITNVFYLDLLKYDFYGDERTPSMAPGAVK